MTPDTEPKAGDLPGGADDAREVLLPPLPPIRKPSPWGSIDYDYVDLQDYARAAVALNQRSDERERAEQPSASGVAGWISVEERMPKQLDFRRVAVLRTDPADGSYFDDDIRLDIVSANHIASHPAEYTHWMPLPDAPQPAGSADDAGGGA